MKAQTEMEPAPPQAEPAGHLLPIQVVRERRMIPLAVGEGVIEVGLEALPPPPQLLRELAFLTGRRPVPVQVSAERVDAYLAQHAAPDAPGGTPSSPGLSVPGPPGTPNTDAALEAAPGPPSEGAPPAGTPQAGTAPGSRPGRLRHADRPAAAAWRLPRTSAVEQAGALLHRAVDLRASDAHLEPTGGFVRLRYRLDGALQEADRLPTRYRDALTSRLKLLAGLDIAEKRRPQDGRIRLRVDDREVDFRASTLPVQHGEKVVLRVLDRAGSGLPLEEGLKGLGLRGRDLDAVRAAIARPHGLVLATGPTGSGKTTTLYAALAEIARPELNVLTCEDPVEYRMEGVNQTTVRPEIGLTFDVALRAFLRQDPDVVMVGEVRDAETARIAVRAALTGHLVLSTLHTNDAPSAAARLADMGVEPYLVAAALRLALAQRLVRRVCPHCRERVPLTAEEARHLGAGSDAGAGSGAACWRGAGCAACRGTGYRGRAALYEVLPVTEALGALVARSAPMHELRAAAREAGMRTLRAAATEAVREGVTTPEEALRATAA